MNGKDVNFATLTNAQAKEPAMGARAVTFGAHKIGMKSRKEQTMRLIDADALIKSIESDRNCSDMPSQWIDGVNYAIDLIELYEPTIDAVEVVHGEWKPFDLTWGRSFYACSVCGEVEYLPCDAFNGKPLFKFCPNCGCRMKGADDE